MKTTSAESQLAEATARVIAGAAKIDLRPHKLGITDHGLRVLARAHVELCDQVHALHGLVDLTDPADPIGVALTKVGLVQGVPSAPALHEQLWQPLENLGLSTRALNGLMHAGLCYVGELVQLCPPTLLRLKNFGKASLCEVEEKLARHSLLLGNPLDEWPGPRWECMTEYPYLKKVGPQLVTAQPPVQETASGPQIEVPHEPLLALYCRVMGEVAEVFVKHASYVVRLWDGMDGCWIDCTVEVNRQEALRVWADRTEGGTCLVAYAEIDYYRIFPGGTRMLWDGSGGSEGEMHR